MPTISGTGAVMYYFSSEGKIGIRTCSQRKGKTKAKKASTAYPKTVLDCETKMTFFSRRIASKTEMIACKGRNLKMQ
jgi:hypothetical protein